MFCGLQMHHLRSRVRADQLVMFISDIAISYERQKLAALAGKIKKNDQTDGFALKSSVRQINQNRHRPSSSVRSSDSITSSMHA